ncbi:MAG: hypothetical protein ACREB5_12030 [Sphingomonadaceae bacterium]
MATTAHQVSQAAATLDEEFNKTKKELTELDSRKKRLDELNQELSDGSAQLASLRDQIASSKDLRYQLSALRV